MLRETQVRSRMQGRRRLAQCRINLLVSRCRKLQVFNHSSQVSSHRLLASTPTCLRPSSHSRMGSELLAPMDLDRLRRCRQRRRPRLRHSHYCRRRLDRRRRLGLVCRRRRRSCRVRRRGGEQIWLLLVSYPYLSPHLLLAKRTILTCDTSPGESFWFLNAICHGGRKWMRWIYGIMRWIALSLAAWRSVFMREADLFMRYIVLRGRDEKIGRAHV